MTATQRFLEASRAVWDGYNAHPFVRGIADGTLDPEKFKFYMIQDYLYLIDYIKVFSLGAARTEDLETVRLFAGYTQQIGGGEMEIHRGYMARLGIDLKEAENTPVSLDNITYTSYMIRTAYEGGAAETMAAVLACALSYEVIARRIVEEFPHAEEHPFYGEWISGYASDGYHEENLKLIAAMDRLAEGLSEDRLAKLTDIFMNCSRLETAFWDMAWEMRP